MRIEENAGKLPDIKKAADRASSVCRRQEFYLKSGSCCYQKTLGMYDSCLGSISGFPALLRGSAGFRGKGIQ